MRKTLAGLWIVGALTLVVVSVGVVAFATGRQPAPSGELNLIEDPLFESGVSGFAAQDSSSSVTQSPQAPLEGAHSLRVSIAGYGNNVWWTREFSGGLASRLVVSAHLRSDVSSGSTLRFCAMVYYADQSTALECTGVSAAAGDKGAVTAQLDLDPARRLESVRVRLVQEGNAPVTFSLDRAVVNLTVIEAPTDDGGSSGGGGGDGGGGGGGGDNAPTCSPSAASRYPGFTYNLPSTRPFISLEQYAQGERNGAAYSRFKAAADAAVAGNPPYAYSATHSVIMYRLTGSFRYIDDADGPRRGVRATSRGGDCRLAAGRRSQATRTSKWARYLEELALAYDAGYDRLTGDQRERWPAFAEQTLTNVWNPAAARWGGVAHPWSGWSICDPGNNYHFSFLRATMLWALASQSNQWLDFLQTQKFGPLVDYYAQLPGGGSREGTGYGTAQKNLFENYLYWVNSTGENLAGLTAHTRETIDYWLHATVPTRDRFAPIGDQSRSSMPELVRLSREPGARRRGAEPRHRARRDAARGGCSNNSVNGVTPQLQPARRPAAVPGSPARRRPIWLITPPVPARCLRVRAGRTTQRGWRSSPANTTSRTRIRIRARSRSSATIGWRSPPNIWSHSGINQGVNVHNVVRFERADGSTIPQSASDDRAVDA